MNLATPTSTPGDQDAASNSPRARKPAAWLTHTFATRTYLGKPWTSPSPRRPDTERPFRLSHLRSRVALCEPAKHPNVDLKGSEEAQEADQNAEAKDDARPKPMTFAEVVRRLKEEQEAGIRRAQMKFIPARLVPSREPPKQQEEDPQVDSVNLIPFPVPGPVRQPNKEDSEEEGKQSYPKNLILRPLSWTSVQTPTSESEDFLRELDDELEDDLLHQNPTPVHPTLKCIQSHLRATIPRNGSGEVSQDAIYGACVPYVVFCLILLIGVFGPRSAFFKALLGEGVEGEVNGWRTRFMGLGMLACGAVLVALVVLRGLVWMGVKVFQDMLDMEVVDARDVEERREMTHRELLASGYLN